MLKTIIDNLNKRVDELEKKIHGNNDTMNTIVMLVNAITIEIDKIDKRLDKIHIVDGKPIIKKKVGRPKLSITTKSMG